jgi:hypothetical protein
MVGEYVAGSAVELSWVLYVVKCAVVPVAVGEDVCVGVQCGDAEGFGVELGVEVGVAFARTNSAIKKRSSYAGYPDAGKYSLKSMLIRVLSS